MGVHGLWEILAPSSRPVRVEALRNRKLAVDASIWIYQFLKAVRDNEGNQMKNSHIVGFFRRICKLLYFGIKPVFVFDGSVPVLKRKTIQKRKEKREGNRESIQQIAHKILAKRLQEFADGKLSSPKKPKRSVNTSTSTKATRIEKPTNELYFDAYYDDENGITNNGNTESSTTIKSKKPEKESPMFKQQDEYDLPVLNNGIKKDSSDTRLMADNEYERLTSDIKDGLDEIDLDNINPQSKEFTNLPLSTQYIVLSHLRLRSRLRMGYTKTQLQKLFPDPMEFSKFQIKMVQKRNYFTQKIMNVTGMDGDINDDIISRRIASDKNRAYNLKRIGDGYALSISKQEIDGNSYKKPVFLEDNIEKPKIEEISDHFYSDNSENDDIDWDDVEVVSESVKTDFKKPERKEKKKEKVEKVEKVENPLFLQDSDESENSENDDDDDESIEMEDVTDAPVLNNTEDGEDEIMKQIQYLYDYSNKHNKKKSNETDTVPETEEKEFTVISDDDDMDEYHEIQIKQIEEEELRLAVERSKNDYLNSLDEEKNGKSENNKLNDEVPIILSTSSLAKTLKLPNFSMKNNLLFGGSSNVKKSEPKRQNQPVVEISDVEDLDDGNINHLKNLNNEDNQDIEKKEKEEGKEEEKKKPLPLPEWFTNASDFKESDVKEKSENKVQNQTNDEKAGLISYGDVENYFSSDDDNDIDFIEVTNSKNEIVDLESEDGNGINDGEVIDLDDVDEEKKVVDTDDQFENENENKGPRGRGEDTLPQHVNVGKSADEPSEAYNVGTVRNDEAENSDRSHSIETSKPHNLMNVLSGNKSVNDIDENDDSGDDDFSDEDEVNLLLDMADEGSSYNNFIDNLQNNGTNSNAKTSTWNIDDEAKFQEQLKKQKRDSDEVSTKMIYDIQDLLSRFGIPFITAPMEAEAQCAELKLLGLVDGIITDDSDCFLFGGDRIYKNLFNDKHTVECYQNDDIIYELGINRNNMIELAILLGSDYTEGIKGVGKVTAMEILGEFKTLEKFKEWWVDYQHGIIDTSTDTPIRKKIRKKLSKKLFIGNDFPNKLIYEAYTHPEVDHDKTQFKWGQPNIEKLRTYLKYNIGWNEEKVDDILSPVIKNMGKPQTSIEEFFSVESVQRRRKLDLSKGILDATEKLKEYQTKKRSGYGDGDGNDESSINKRLKV